MRINAKKTKLLLISPRNGCITFAAIPQGGEAVEHMKLVGFVFGSTPSAGPHVNSIIEQYKRKKWMLYHLRSSGL